jgi:hypothetical protein
VFNHNKPILRGSKQVKIRQSKSDRKNPGTIVIPGFFDKISAWRTGGRVLRL